MDAFRTDELKARLKKAKVEVKLGKGSRKILMDLKSSIRAAKVNAKLAKLGDPDQFSAAKPKSRGELRAAAKALKAVVADRITRIETLLSKHGG